MIIFYTHNNKTQSKNKYNRIQQNTKTTFCTNKKQQQKTKKTKKQQNTPTKTKNKNKNTKNNNKIQNQNQKQYNKYKKYIQFRVRYSWAARRVIGQENIPQIITRPIFLPSVFLMRLRCVC